MFLGVNMFLASIWIVTSITNGFICSERTAEDVRASSFLEARAILDYYNSDRVDVLGRKYVFGKHIWIVTSITNGFICSERTAEDVRASSFLEARAILDIGRQALFILVL